MQAGYHLCAYLCKLRTLAHVACIYIIISILASAIIVYKVANSIKQNYLWKSHAKQSKNI